MIQALLDERFLDQVLGKRQPAAGEPGQVAEVAVRLVRAARRSPSSQAKRARPPGRLFRTALEQLGFRVRGARTRCPGSQTYWLSSQHGDKIALAVCCSPGRSLDRADPSDPENPRLVPELRAIRLARRLRAPWVILTNGGQWRVYRSGSDADQLRTYQVDLRRAVQAWQAGAGQDLRRWKAVFEAGSFVSQPNRGQCLLDELARQYRREAQHVEARLIDRAVRRVLPRLAERLLAEAIARDGWPPQPDSQKLGLLHRSAALLLYWLVWSVQTDARDLSAHRWIDGRRRRTANPIRNWGPLSNLLNEARSRFGTEWHAAARFVVRWELDETDLGDALRLLASDPLAGTDGRPRPAHLDSGLLGRIHERVMSVRLELCEPGEPADTPTTNAPKNARSVRLRTRPSRAARKATGSFYTPGPIVRQVVKEAVEPVLTGHFQRLEHTLRIRPGRKNGAGDLMDHVLDLAVVDPALGCGQFLREAMDSIAIAVGVWLDEHDLAADIVQPQGLGHGEVPSSPDTDACAEGAAVSCLAWLRRLVLARCLFGVDSDPLAVELAKLCLSLEVTAGGVPAPFLEHHVRWADSLVGEGLNDKRPERPNARGQTIKRCAAVLGRASKRSPLCAPSMAQDRRLFRAFQELTRPTRRRMNLGVARDVGQKDALQARPMHWWLDFADVFCRPGRAGFDAVIGNPPWVSFSGRQRQVVPPGLLRYWSKHYGGFAGWRSTHGLFLERATRLVRPGGYVGLVLPAQICDLEQYGPLRRAVQEQAILRQPVMAIGEEGFAGVTEPAGIFVLVGRDGRAMAARQDAARKWPCGQTTKRSGICVGPALPGRIRKAVERFPPLSPGAFRDVGVHTGNSAELLIGPRPTKGRCAPIREGRDIQRYHLGPARRWVRLDLPADDGRYWRIGAAQTYGQARLLIRQTADRPIAARHEQPAYFRNSVLAFFGQDGLDDDYVLAVLNSRLTARLHRCQYGDASQRAFPQVKIRHLRNLRLPQEPMGPLEPAAREQVRRLRQRLDAAIRGRQAEQGIGLDIGGASVVVLEHLLAHLGRTMTRLAQEHSALASQTQPGRLRARPPAGRDGQTGGQQERPETSAAMYRVAEQMAKVDALTDELVYRMYGLTAEDPRLLETPAARQESLDRREGIVWD